MKKFKTNSFYVLAEKYRKAVTDEHAIETTDMTEDFFKELNTMIKAGEIIIININAKMRLGKSTVGMALGVKIFEMLKAQGYQKQDNNFSMQNIARDQQEKSKMMRNPELQHTVIVTDEDNELEKGGENSSAESALNKVFSDVQAGRYVHSICCSPKELTDPNADVLLSLVSMDKSTRTTRAKLYYKYFEGGMEHIQLLGFVDIDVSNIITNWEDKIKPIFFKPKKTQKEQDIIKKYAKKDFYIDYTIKKYEKMELITKEGIFRPRMLDYAEVILEVINALKHITKLKGVLNKDIARNFVKTKMREHKLPMSIIGEELATREAMGILTTFKSYYETQSKIKRLESKFSTDQLDSIKEELEELDKIKEILWTAITVQTEELEKYKEINNKYNNHFEEQT